MGRDKALIDVDGKPLVARVTAVLRGVFGHVVVVTPLDDVATAAGVPAITDVYPGKGPLAGIHAALRHWDQPTFCVACDMPHLDADFIHYQCAQLDTCDVVVPRAGDFVEPLHAVYTPSCLGVMERELARDRVGPVPSIYRELNVRVVTESEARRFDPTLRMFENWNTPDDVGKGTHTE